jgi:hypothetical protein
VISKVMFFAVFLLQTAIFGADWTRVTALRAGETVRIETASGKQTGRFISASDEAVRFTSGGGLEVSVARSEAKRVYVQSQSRRVRNTIIGAAVGVAVGAVIYGTLGTLFRNEGDEQTGYMLALPIAAGTAVGAALPTGSMKKVYDAK